MLNVLLSIGTMKPYIFGGLVILGLVVFVGYSMIGLHKTLNHYFGS